MYLSASLAGSAVPWEIAVDMSHLCSAGLWIVPELEIWSWIRQWASDALSRLTECHYFSLIHLWILTSPKNINRISQYRHCVRNVCCDAVGSLGVIPLRSALTPGQPLPKCSPLCLSVPGIKAPGGSAHLCHAQLCPARVCSMAVPAAVTEGVRPESVHWVVCGSVYRRGGWSGVTVTRGSSAAGSGPWECYSALPPAPCQAAEAQRQHPWPLGWGWDSWGPPSIHSLISSTQRSKQLAFNIWYWWIPSK